MEKYYRFAIIHRLNRQKFQVVAISFFEACRTLGYPENLCYLQRAEHVAHPNQAPLFHLKGKH